MQQHLQIRTKMLKFWILAFIITPALVLASTTPTEVQTATASTATTIIIATPSSTLPTPQTTTTTTVTQTTLDLDGTTTTTLASSNAPATITNDLDIPSAEATETTATHDYKLENDRGQTTTPTMTETTMTATMTMLPQAATNANTGVAAIRLASKSRAPHSSNADNEDNEDNNGNEAKIEIENAKEQTVPTTINLDETTTTPTQTLHQQQATNVQETATKMAIFPTETEKFEMQTVAASDVVDATSISTQAPAALGEETTTDILEQHQLKNGLYRIKLAEIVTDEFSGLQAPKSVVTATKNAEIFVHTTQLPAERETQQTVELVVEAEEAEEEQKVVVQELEQQEERHYEVQEENAGSIFNNRNNVPSKLNIVDFYPMKMEDFNPILRDSNAKLLKERRPIFMRADNIDEEEHRQNLLPNEVEVLELAQQKPVVITTMPTTTTTTTTTIATNDAAKRNGNAPTGAGAINRSTGTTQQEDAINDFTGKLLAEQDGVITEIEQKFHLNDLATATELTTLGVAANNSGITTTTPKSSQVFNGHDAAKFSFSVNHEKPQQQRQQRQQQEHVHDFIERRVKKSFDFPMHRAASDVMSMPHVDFANTKFNTDTSSKPAAAAAVGSALSGTATNGKAMSAGVASNMAAAAHPEFSTTKFYNSKELYNEMLQHNKRKQQQQQQPFVLTATATTMRKQVKQTNDFTTSSAALRPTTTDPSQQLTEGHTAAAAILSFNNNNNSKTTKTLTQTAEKSKKTGKELKRAKLLLQALQLTTTASSQTGSAATTTTNSNNNAPNTPAPATIKQTTAAVTNLDVAAATSVSTTASMPLDADSISIAVPTAASSSSASSTTTARSGVNRATFVATARPIIITTDTPSTLSVPSVLSVQRAAPNPTKPSSALKPIARPRIQLSRLQEKINSLECEIQNVPQDSHLWRGNETHELLLPIMSPGSCKDVAGCATTTSLVSWEGEADIQSGDILIVEINDALLMQPSDANNSNTTNSAHTTLVYQVTRPGHEHCDVTEGIVLDITPLVVDGRKLVTLYDKDLTEGVNLLIVVSELWGNQCVRLKVTTKTDNCGENAECSFKGVCFSNPSMEEYECQCCSGFAGPHCEEIDACTPSPCTNNGICVDLSQGHEGNSYQCLCPYGYTGKNCQYESDPCNPAECMNGGSCVGNSTHFRCDCTPGYAGPLCQHSLNECESSPCVHGICVDQEDGFRCFCQPGFAGEICNFEYNECESNPCQNDGECIDHIGSYECRCTKGYTGNRCQIKVDFCANKPCPEGHHCIDHGNDFNCECPGGSGGASNGPDCNQMPRTQCNVNPCTHGGTCWSSGDSFYCACRPGFTGTMCEDEFVVETVVSSSEFMVDDTSARNFNDKTFGSSVVLKSPIELHNAYFAAGVLAAAIFIVAIVVTICHCKVNQTYRKFSTRSNSFFPILGFGRRSSTQHKLNKHWLSGKGLGSGNPLRSSATSTSLMRNNINNNNNNNCNNRDRDQHHNNNHHHHHHNQQQQQQQQVAGGQLLHERPFQRHLAMNLENDMYYTVDFSEHSQNSPLIQ